MNDRILHKLGFARKLLLTAVASLALAAPVLYGLFHATPTQAQTQTETATAPTPVFDTVSIKKHNVPDASAHSKMMFSLQDGDFVAQGVTLRRLIQMAYHLQDDQVAAGPEWLDSDHFDVIAKLKKERVAGLQEGMQKDLRVEDQPVLRALLTDYFKVAVHQEARNLSAYELTVDEGGSKLQEVKQMGMFHLGPGELVSQGVPIELLANQLSGDLHRPVVDQTGLKGLYAFNLRWAQDPNERRKVIMRDVAMKDGHPEESTPPPPVIVPDQQSLPPLLTAIQEQLGLKLEPKTEPVPVLVVDHAEQPTEN